MRSRWMAAMVFAVVAFYSLLALSGLRVPRETLQEQALQERQVVEEIQKRETIARQNLEARPRLAGALSAAFLAVLFWGLFLDVYFLRRLGRSRTAPTEMDAPRGASWGGRDVFHAMMFLLFMEAFIFLAHDLLRVVFGSEGEPSDTVLLTASFLRDLFVAAFVWMIVKSGYGQGTRELGLRSARPWAHVRAGVLGYIAIVPLLLLTFSLLAFVMNYFSWQPSPQAVVQIYLKPSTEPFLIPLTIFVALIGPVMEEVFFRGFAYAGMRARFGVWGAAVLSASAFAALHMNWGAFVPIFLLGLFLAYLYESSGSLVGPITAHILHNGIMVSMTLGFKSLSA